MFSPSDKVVCVEDRLPPEILRWYTFPNGTAKKGVVYCVSHMAEHQFDGGADLTVHITGLPVVWVGDGEEVGWPPQRFRKLDEIRRENQLKRENLQESTTTAVTTHTA